MKTDPTTIVVRHRGVAAAICTPERVYFVAAVEALPDHHPDRMHVAAKCLVAGAILRGDVAGPYDDAEATQAALLLTEAQLEAAHDPDPGEHAGPGAYR